MEKLEIWESLPKHAIQPDGSFQHLTTFIFAITATSIRVMCQSHNESSKSNSEGDDVQKGDRTDWTGQAGEHDMCDDNEDNRDNSL